jgi:hypothetical protein
LRMNSGVHERNMKIAKCRWTLDFQRWRQISSVISLSLTLAPIWFPHCPAWMCTISLMLVVFFFVLFNLNKYIKYFKLVLFK